MKTYIRLLKYRLLRRWLVEEMLAAGWQQHPGDATRLLREEMGAISTLRINLADHEAASRHLKEFPLQTTPPPRP